MIIWFFDNPLRMMASIIWNISEYFNLPLGKYAPIVFKLMLGKKYKKEN